ncbi:MAG: hypothetical protein IPH89_10990 [Bacteroidetes bacterium]|nr:hypothetical protein [Bacteroidota bacterium]
MLAEIKIGGPAYPNNQLNGFFVRDDVNSSFNQNWLGEYTNTEDTKDRYEGINSAFYIDRFPIQLEQRSKNEMSQDQMIGLIMGFSFVNKLVGHVFVKPTGSDNGFYLDTEVKNLTNRIS